MAFLNISTQNKKGVLKQIDDQNYFGLSDCSRLDLYSFMVALGYDRGYATDFGGAKESLVREEYTKSSNICHAFSAIYFSENKGCVEEIANTDKVFELVDKYANTGFSVIADYMRSYGQQGLTMKLLSDMDLMFEKYKDSL